MRTLLLAAPCDLAREAVATAAASGEVVDLVDTTEAALDAHQRSPYAVVIIDQQLARNELPGLCRLLRKASGSRPLSLVSLLDDVDEETIARLSDLRFCSWIEKPLSRNAIRRIVFTEGSRARAAAAESFDGKTQALLRRLTQSGRVVMFALDAEGKFLLSEGGGLRHMGLEPGEVVGCSAFEMYRDVPVLVDSIRRALAGERVSTRVTLDGFVFHTQYSPDWDESGRICGVLGLSTDITEQAAAEEALGRAIASFRSLIDDSPTLSLVCRDGQVVYANRAAATHLGRAIEQLLHQPPASLVWAEERARLEIAMEQVLADGIDRHLGEATWGERCEQPLVADVRVVRVSFDGSPAVLLLADDVTERKRTERELRQAHKLEAVGRLAAGVAHEINTPVQYAYDSANFLREAIAALVGGVQAHQALLTERLEAVRPLWADEAARLEKTLELSYFEAEAPKAAGMVMDGLERVAHIVRGMKRFAHPDARDMAPADLNGAIRDTLVVASGELKYVAHVHTDLQELPPVICHVGDLGQVLLNLLLNAAQAVRDRPAPGDDPRGNILVRTRLHDGAVEISVSDDGSGIAEDVGDRVFEPFFTTKPIGQGTGQGLAIARAIVEKHRGTIRFESVLGRGTTFFVRLPMGTADLREHTNGVRAA